MRAFVPMLLLLVACQSSASMGAICTSNGACTSPLVCRFGRCRTECVQNRDCPLGAQCYLDANGQGACELDVDRSCGSSSCGGGLVCLGSTCVRACAIPTDCPTDGTCTLASGETIGICTDTRDADAGVPPDAGATGCTAPLSDATHVCAGIGFSCAIRMDTSVVCWGSGHGAEVGRVPTDQCTDTGGSVGECAKRPIPVALGEGGALTGAVEIDCGASHACVRLASGHVRCWGRNFEGMLGVPTDGVVGGQEVVDGSGVALDGVTDIAVGYSHTCALRGGASVACWGLGTMGELGDGAMESHGAALEATALEMGAPITQVLAMGAATCVVDDTHHLSCLGINDHGELGMPTTTFASSSSLVPLSIALGTTDVVAALEGSGCFLDESAHVQCWGWDVALGRMGTVLEDHPEAAPVYGPAAGLAFDALFTGSTAQTECAITGGQVHCWGEDSRGTAAVDPQINAGQPVHVTALSGIVEGACSETHCCAVDDSHRVWCWGGNDDAQLGRGISGPDDWMPGTVCAP